MSGKKYKERFGEKVEKSASLDYLIVKIGDKIFSTKEDGENIGKINISNFAHEDEGQEGRWMEGRFIETNKHKKLEKPIPFVIDIYYKKVKIQ